MATDVVTATDEINEIINDVVARRSASGHRVRVRARVGVRGHAQEQDGPGHRAHSSRFGRVTIRHASSAQRTLGGIDQRVFTNEGVVIVQVFTPRDDGTSRRKCLRLADVVKRAMQGQRTANVWFRNVVAQEIGDEDQWYHINVVSNFEWDELR